MNNKRLLKCLIISQWIILITGIIIGFVEEKYLPDLLRLYVAERDNAELTRYEAIVMIVGMAFLIAYFISSIGLLINKKWSRWLYLYANICGFVLVLFMGPEVSAPISGALDGLSMVLIGVTIGVLYFSDTKKYLNH